LRCLEIQFTLRKLHTFLCLGLFISKCCCVLVLENLLFSCLPRPPKFGALHRIYEDCDHLIRCGVRRALSFIIFLPVWIRTISIPDPGSSSKKLSILTPKKQKNGFQALKNMIRVVHPGSRIQMLTFSHPGSRIRNTDIFCPCQFFSPPVWSVGPMQSQKHHEHHSDRASSVQPQRGRTVLIMMILYLLAGPLRLST